MPLQAEKLEKDRGLKINRAKIPGTHHTPHTALYTPCALTSDPALLDSLYPGTSADVALMSRGANFRPDPVPLVDAAARQQVHQSLSQALLRWRTAIIADVPGISTSADFGPWMTGITESVQAAIQQLPEGLVLTPPDGTCGGECCAGFTPPSSRYSS